MGLSQGWGGSLGHGDGPKDGGLIGTGAIPGTGRIRGMKGLLGMRGCPGDGCVPRMGGVPGMGGSEGQGRSQGQRGFQGQGQFQGGSGVPGTGKVPGMGSDPRDRDGVIPGTGGDPRDRDGVPQGWGCPPGRTDVLDDVGDGWLEQLVHGLGGHPQHPLGRPLHQVDAGDGQGTRASPGTPAWSFPVLSHPPRRPYPAIPLLLPSPRPQRHSRDVPALPRCPQAAPPLTCSCGARSRRCGRGVCGRSR